MRTRPKRHGSKVCRPGWPGQLAHARPESCRFPRQAPPSCRPALTCHAQDACEVDGVLNDVHLACRVGRMFSAASVISKGLWYSGTSNRNTCDTGRIRASGPINTGMTRPERRPFVEQQKKPAVAGFFVSLKSKQCEITWRVCQQLQLQRGGSWNGLLRSCCQPLVASRPCLRCTHGSFRYPWTPNRP
jgi:hypothetical protein